MQPTSPDSRGPEIEHGGGDFPSFNPPKSKARIALSLLRSDPDIRTEPKRLSTGMGPQTKGILGPVAVESGSEKGANLQMRGPYPIQVFGLYGIPIDMPGMLSR